MSDEIEWWEEQPKLWDALVPSSGHAESVQGELIRRTGKLSDEAYRNGNQNWESGYDKIVEYVAKHLSDTNTFSSVEIKKIQTAAKAIVADYDCPDLSGHGSPHYYLTEMAVRWCLANPELLPHSEEMDLRV